MPHPRAPLLDAPPLVRHGLPIYETRANPAAGAQFTETIDGNFLTRLVTLSVRIVTDANAANRTLRLEYLDTQGNVFAVAGNPVTYPANSTEDYFFDVWQGQGEWEVNAANLVPLKPLLLPPTFAFRIAVNNIQATDQLSRIRFTWEQFYTRHQPPIPNGDSGY
jgi:hypothetical protein